MRDTIKMKPSTPATDRCSSAPPLLTSDFGAAERRTMDPWPSVCPYPFQPKDVFRDFRARRAGIVRALTTDVDKFYEKCVSENKDLCLYGLPNETWEVKPPTNSAPPILPEPAQGINQACVGLPLNDWRLLVAVHSDSWLLALAFYYGNIYGFDKETRRQLFMMITDLPTVLEVIMGSVNEQPKTSIGSSKDKSGSKQPDSNSDPAKHPLPKDQKQIGKEDNMCGVCEKVDEGGEFWIGCDFCRKWFHGECVRITPAMAEEIAQYKCPRCITKRSIE